MAVDWSEERRSSMAGSPARRRRWAWIWYVVLTPLVAGVVCLLGLRHHWRAEFHRRVEAVRAAGFPVTLQELEASYPWPQGGDNAANWILSAATLYRKVRGDEDSKRLERLLSRSGDRHRPTEPLSADLEEVLEIYLQANDKALEALHGAAAIPECRYPIDLSQGYRTALPHISQVRDGYRLLCLEAVLWIEDRDPNGAAAAIEAALHVARSLDKEPVMFSRMMQMAGTGLAGVVLERALNHVEFSEKQLAKLNRAFGGVGGDEGLVRALAGERCMSLAFLEKPQAVERWPSDGLPPPAFLEAYDALGLSAREGVIYLDHIEECLRAIRLPAFQRRRAIEAADAHYRHSRGRGVLLSVTGHAANIMRVDTEYSMRLEMVKTVLAVERHRLAQTGFPERLDQLVPTYLAAVPEDAFSGAPLRYQRTDRGFMVYSVGQDGKDDGGKEEPPKELKKPGETWDLVFKVERPASGKENTGSR